MYLYCFYSLLLSYLCIYISNGFLVGSIVVSYICFLIWQSLPIVGMLRRFKFNVIIDMIKFKSTTLLFAFYYICSLFPFFLFSYFFKLNLIFFMNWVFLIILFHFLCWLISYIFFGLISVIALASIVCIFNLTTVKYYFISIPPFVPRLSFCLYMCYNTYNVIIPIMLLFLLSTVDYLLRRFK